MNNAYKLSLVIDQIKTAGVTFEPFGKVYTFLTIIPDLKEGQEVIVETGESNSLKVAIVVAVHEEAEINPNAPYKYRWILSTAGTAARKEQERLRLLQEQALKILKTAERQEAKKRIQKQLEDIYGDSLKSVKSINFREDMPKELE